MLLGPLEAEAGRDALPVAAVVLAPGRERAVVLALIVRERLVGVGERADPKSVLRRMARGRPVGWSPNCSTDGGSGSFAMSGCAARYACHSRSAAAWSTGAFGMRTVWQKRVTRVGSSPRE